MSHLSTAWLVTSLFSVPLHSNNRGKAALVDEDSHLWPDEPSLHPGLFLTTFMLAWNTNRVYKSAVVWVLSIFSTDRVASSINSCIVQGDGTKGLAATVNFSGAALQAPTYGIPLKWRTTCSRDVPTMRSLPKPIQQSFASSGPP